MKYIGTTEIAKRLDVTSRTVSDWCRSGYIPGERIGARKWAVREDLLERFIRRHQRGEIGQYRLLKGRK